MCRSHRRAAPIALIAGAMALGTALGQQHSTETLRFPISGFRVTGSNPLGEAAVREVLQPFARADADMALLQQAVAALKKALQSQGFDLHQVVLPPQALAGEVTLEIVPVTLAQVSVEGNTLRSEQRIRSLVPELREGLSPSLTRVGVQTAIANQNPHRRIDVAIAESSSPAQVDAVVRVTESSPLTLALSLSNHGSPETGRDRTTFSVLHSDVLARDHQLAAAYTTSLQRPSSVKQAGVSYAVPLPAQSAVAAAAFTRSNVVGQFGNFTSTGAGHVLQMSYTLHLPATDRRRTEVALLLDDKVFRAAQINGVPVGVERRSRPLRARYQVTSQEGGNVWRVAAEVAANLPFGRGNDVGAHRAEYPEIRSARWKALRGEAEYSRPLASDWSLLWRLGWQYSPDALITGEQFGLGGTGSVRGTRTERPIAGDSGVATTLEVASPLLWKAARAHAFFDAGWIANHAADGQQRIARDQLASWGLGLRYADGRFNGSAEYGRLLRGSRMPTEFNPVAPRKSEDRFYVGVGVQF